MAYDDDLVVKVREALIDQPQIEEKKMFGGMCFMVNGKMCICVRDDNLLCRIGPENMDSELEKGNCREMIHGGRTMKGFIFVDQYGYKNRKDFMRLVQLCINYNPIAPASKK